MLDSFGSIRSGALLGGRYRLGALIGQGGMGSVFEAVQEDLGRRVAVKVLDSRLAADLTQVERFRREAQAAALLGHPNIVAVTDFQWPAGESPFLVMEHLRGESLGALLDRSGRLTVQRIAFIASQILDALAAAHVAGIVHRDIKPDNIFLTSVSGLDDVVKLLDFGVAKLSDPSASKLTESGAMVGTPAYMSPEQTRGIPVDARADLYAVGAVMYHALTGEMPFRGPSVPAVIVAIATSAPQPISELTPDVPSEFAALVHRAMAKEPAFRFGSAVEMRAATAPWAGAALFTPASHVPVGGGHEGISSTARTVAGPPSASAAVVVRSNPPADGLAAFPSSSIGVPSEPSRGGRRILLVALPLGLAAIVGLLAVGLIALANALRKDDPHGSSGVVAVDLDASAPSIAPSAALAADSGLLGVRPAVATTRPASWNGMKPPPTPSSAAVVDAPTASETPVGPSVDTRLPAETGALFSGTRGRFSGSNFGDCPSCDWEGFNEAIRSHDTQTSACYAETAHAPPNHEYQTLRVAVNANGSFGTIAPAGQATNARFDTCLAGVIRATAPSFVKKGTAPGIFTLSFSGPCPTFNCK